MDPTDTRIGMSARRRGGRFSLRATASIIQFCLFLVVLFVSFPNLCFIFCVLTILFYFAVAPTQSKNLQR